MPIVFAGEKMTDEEVNELLMGQEDAQGNVNYEGVCLRVRAMLVSRSSRLRRSLERMTHKTARCIKVVHLSFLIDRQSIYLFIIDALCKY